MARFLVTLFFGVILGVQIRKALVSAQHFQAFLKQATFLDSNSKKLNPWDSLEKKHEYSDGQVLRNGPPIHNESSGNAEVSQELDHFDDERLSLLEKNKEDLRELIYAEPQVGGWLVEIHGEHPVIEQVGWKKREWISDADIDPALKDTIKRVSARRLVTLMEYWSQPKTHGE